MVAKELMLYEDLYGGYRAPGGFVPIYSLNLSLLITYLLVSFYRQKTEIPREEVTLPRSHC